jgi:hypothetical protein
MLPTLFEMPRYSVPLMLSGFALSVAVACSSPDKAGDAGVAAGSDGIAGAAGTATTALGGSSAGGNTTTALAGSNAGGDGTTALGGSSAGGNATTPLGGSSAGGNTATAGGNSSASGASGTIAIGGTGVPSSGAGGSNTSNTGGSTGAAQGGNAAGNSSASTGGSTGAAQGGGTSVATSYWSLTPASPALTVSFTTEDAARVIKDVPLTGGVLTTLSQDGTSFELTIPSNALISPETIAMTPVHLQTQPFGTGPAWGVQLLPDGLAFNAPLKLVITPPAGQAPAVGKRVPFGWSGASNEVALAYTDSADPGLTLQILHFSSYAYATATQGISASLAGVRNRIGGTAEARIESAMAERFEAMHIAALLGTPDDALVGAAEIEALMQQYEQEVVNVRIAAAGASCAAGRLAVETTIGYERRRQLLGFADINTWGAATASLIDTVTSECLDEEWALCRDQHIVQRLIPVYLGMERQAQLLGIDTTGKAWEAKALDYISRCHRYRLDVDSKAGTVCDEWTFSEPVFGQIKLQLDSLGTGVIQGSDVLTSLSYTIHYSNGCSGVANIVQLDPTFAVQSLDWRLKTDPTAPGKGEIIDFNLIYAPGMSSPGVFGSTHQQTDLCGNPPSPPQTIGGFNWWSIYAVVMGLNPKYFSDTEGWHFQDWTVYNDGGAVLAKKTADEPYNDGGITYTAPTGLVLTHTPG